MELLSNLCSYRNTPSPSQIIDKNMTYFVDNAPPTSPPPVYHNRNSINDAYRLFLHLRRKGHPLPASSRPRQLNIPSQQIPSREAISTSSLPPLAPRPSALHIQAAIALSELGEKRRGDISRCDIGVQTQPVECSGKTREGSKRSSCSPGRASSGGTSSSRRKQEAETQTKEQKRKCLTVSSQVGITSATPFILFLLALGLK